ncbi:MAG: hypothetical protein Q4A72_07110 [Bacillota bacterium]|nr:hypothetical protein [Bacillota bacterium]
MNRIPIEKLYNPQYELLSVDEKKDLLHKIAERYHLELMSFGEFSAFEKATYTAVYRSKEDIEFLFVPGDTVRLGFDFAGKKLHQVFNQENLEELAYVFVDYDEGESDEEDILAEKIKEKLAEEEFLSEIEDYLNHNFSKEEDCVIAPLLVQKEYSETCWTNLSNVELKQNKEWQKMIEKAEKDGVSETTVYKTVCLYQKEDQNWYGKRYEETTFQKLLQDIKAAGYSLPTKREWEYLAGKGCRSIFPWGNNMDFSMKLRHLEWMDNDDEYSLEKENFFGLHIAYDPYCREIVYDKGVFAYKGGDGGRNICGGLGIVWGYFPVSPYFEDNENELGNFINGGYDYFRRVIRITDDFGD